MPPVLHASAIERPTSQNSLKKFEIRCFKVSLPCLLPGQGRRRGCRRCRSASEANVRSRAPSPVYRATMRNGRHVVVKRLEKPSRPTWCSSSAQLSSMTQARQLRPPARLRVRHHGHPLRRPARYRLISLKAGT
jgi:hypothetical protein